MNLPASLHWIEVDLPGILDYKEEILHGEKPACPLDRVCLDLSDIAARRQLFAALTGTAKNVLIITEGLLIYFSRDEVASLAQDLAAVRAFHLGRVGFELFAQRVLLRGRGHKRISRHDHPRDDPRSPLA